MALQEQIDQDIKAAMLAKNEVQLRSLRAVKSALLIARTEKGATGTLDADAEIKIIQRLVKQRRESAEIYQQQGRADLYQVEAEEIEAISAYLPKQLDRDAIVLAVKEIIAQTGAAGMKDMGKVMGAANKQLAGKADGRTISEVVKELLS